LDFSLFAFECELAALTTLSHRVFRTVLVRVSDGFSASGQRANGNQQQNRPNSFHENLPSSAVRPISGILANLRQ
jgi:hypothetical protein